MNLESLCQIPFKKSIRTFKFEVIHLHSITSSHQEAQYALLFFSIVSDNFLDSFMVFFILCIFLGKIVPLYFVVLFVYLWLYQAFIDACRLSLVSSRGYSSCSAQTSHCGGFSCCRAQALECGPQELQYTGFVASWHVESPQIVMKPMSAALAGRFLPTRLSGKSCSC